MSKAQYKCNHFAQQDDFGDFFCDFSLKATKATSVAAAASSAAAAAVTPTAVDFDDPINFAYLVGQSCRDGDDDDNGNTF